MLVTIIRLMYEAVEWLHKWRSRVRCVRLVYEHLFQSSVILQRAADRPLPYSELPSLIGVTSTAARVLWTYGSRQLAVLPSQVKLIVPYTLTLAGILHDARLRNVNLVIRTLQKVSRPSQVPESLVLRPRTDFWSQV